MRNLSENGVTGIHLLGEADLTEILYFCFTGLKIKLLSVIPEKLILEEVEQNKNPSFPNLKSDELIMVASLENQNLVTQLLVQQGFIKNKNWVLFS